MEQGWWRCHCWMEDVVALLMQLHDGRKWHQKVTGCALVAGDTEDGVGGKDCGSWGRDEGDAATDRQ